jgi:hypothetical protein
LATGGPAAPRRAGGTVCNGVGRGSKGTGALMHGPGPFNNYRDNFQIPLKFEIQNRSLPYSQNAQTLHKARLECDEQLFQLALLQIPNIIHDINFGTDSNLNIL